MLRPETFHFIELFGRADLEKHPVWRHYEDSHDRSRILSWGVTGEHLDAELEKFKFCGTEPLYPVLALEPLLREDALNIRVEYTATDGQKFDGYFIDPHAYGIYVGERAFCLNRNLPGATRRAAESLVETLGVSSEALFPLSFSANLQFDDGSPVEGEVEQFW